MNLFLLSVLGLIGIHLRYYFDQFFLNQHSPFPLSTFTANTLGCALAGIVAAYSLAKGHNAYTTALLVGLCGGLTTFSSYILHFIKMMENGFHVKGLSFLILSPVVGILVLWITYSFSKRFLGQ
ncbi:MAG: hypothetical protein CME62_11780 [Halobacteriovoraceae bacterium]|nr:hypothetical protein [Halobacteriovoraceae bacterium]|tara:strand:+ start:7556 stop:7927 length:372 start_codon:yes stop_codon:yes gene_type:complete